MFSSFPGLRLPDASNILQLLQLKRFPDISKRPIKGKMDPAENYRF